jgi:hypothetical protein
MFFISPCVSGKILSALNWGHGFLGGGEVSLLPALVASDRYVDCAAALSSGVSS